MVPLRPVGDKSVHLVGLEVEYDPGSLAFTLKKRSDALTAKALVPATNEAIDTLMTKDAMVWFLRLRTGFM